MLSFPTFRNLADEQPLDRALNKTIEGCHGSWQLGNNQQNTGELIVVI